MRNTSSALHWTLLVALLASPVVASAQRTTNGQESRALYNPVISADGAWVAAEERSDRGDGSVRVWSKEGNLIFSIERGQNPRISRDSRWVSALQKPPFKESKTAKPKKKRTGQTLVLLDTQSGLTRTFEFVLSYDVTYSPSYLVYLQSPETTSDEERAPKAKAARLAAKPAAKEREVGTLHLVNLKSDKVFTIANVARHVAHETSNHIAYVLHDEETGRDRLRIAALGPGGWGARGEHAGDKIEGLRWARDITTLGFLDSTETLGKDGKRRVNSVLYTWDATGPSVPRKFTRMQETQELGRPATTPSAQEKSKSTEQFVSEIDEKIPQLLRDFSVPGAAIAIIENGETVLQKGYGFSDIEKAVKVHTKTGFNIGSISKTIAAWGVMKLVHEGKIDLDAPAEKYLSRWRLPDSEFDASEVTIRRLLSHTAGLSLHGYPGWSPKDKLPTIEESLNGKNNGPGRVEIIMQPGTQYKYSGGGYTVLQLIIEEVTGKKFEDYMQAQILDPLGMTSSSYKIDDSIMAASASGHNNYGEVIDFELFTAQAAAGLHTTIEDFTRFAYANLHRNKDLEKHNPVLPGNVIEQMMKPVPQARGRYGYGMGYFAESIPGTSIALGGHRGANAGWHAIFTVNPETNDGFIMVTNGGAGHHVYSPMLYDWMLWETGVRLEDWHNARPPIANKLKSIIDSKGIDGIAASYNELKKNRSEKYDFAWGQLNTLGYYYMGKDDMEKAIALFKLNVEAFPNFFGGYDSYGEALLKHGARGEAIENYKESVKLNLGHEHGMKVLNELGVSTDDLIKRIPKKALETYPGRYRYNAEHVFTIERKRGRLFMRYAGWKPQELLYVGDGRFMRRERRTPITFTEEEGEPVFHFMLDDGSHQSHARMSEGEMALRERLLFEPYKQALAAYRAALKATPEEESLSERYLNSQGLAMLDHDEFEGAIALLKINTELYPDSANTWDSVGHAYRRKGKRKQAIRYYEQALKIDPDFRSTKEALKELRDR